MSCEDTVVFQKRRVVSINTRFPELRFTEHKARAYETFKISIVTKFFVYVFCIRRTRYTFIPIKIFSMIFTVLCLNDSHRTSRSRRCKSEQANVFVAYTHCTFSDIEPPCQKMCSECICVCMSVFCVYMLITQSLNKYNLGILH